MVGNYDIFKNKKVVINIFRISDTRNIFPESIWYSLETETNVE